MLCVDFPPGENGQDETRAEAGAGVRYGHLCLIQEVPGSWRSGNAEHRSGAAEGLHFRAVIQVDV